MASGAGRSRLRWVAFVFVLLPLGGAVCRATSSHRALGHTTGHPNRTTQVYLTSHLTLSHALPRLAPQPCLHRLASCY